MEEGRLVPPSRLAEDEVFWALPCDAAYPLAGAFVAFLVEWIGMAAFLDTYYRQPQPRVSGLDEAFERWLARQ